MQVAASELSSPIISGDEPPPETSNRNNFCTIVWRGLSAIVDILCWIWEKFVALLTCSCWSTPQTSSATQPPPDTTTTTHSSSATSAPPQPQPTPTTADSSVTVPTPQPPSTPPSSPLQATSAQPDRSAVSPTLAERYTVELTASFTRQNHGYSVDSNILTKFFQLLTPYQNSVTNLECIVPPENMQQLRFRFYFIKITTERAADVVRALTIGPQIRGDITTNQPPERLRGFDAYHTTMGIIPRSNENEVVVNLDYMKSRTFYEGSPAALSVSASNPSPIDQFKETFKTFLIQSNFSREEIYTIADNFFRMLAPYEAQIANVEFIILKRSGDREDKYIRITTQGSPAELTGIFRALPKWDQHNAVITSSSSRLFWNAPPICDNNQLVLDLFGSYEGQWFSAFMES